MKELQSNIDILQRKLVQLKDNIIKDKGLSRGQIHFLDAYLTVVDDYINKSLDILDDDKYREALLELDA